MRIALYGPFMFELAAGLRENRANEVQLFLDEETLPRSLLDEPLVRDPSFVRIGPWATRRAILRPRGAPITRALAEQQIGIEAILQKDPPTEEDDARIMIVTKPARESSLNEVLDHLRPLPYTRDGSVHMRVAQFED